MTVSHIWGKVVGLFLLLVGAGVILSYYWVTAGGTLPFSGHSYTVSALISDPQELLKHGDVDAAGIRIGTISEITNKGGLADVQMQLDHRIAPLYRNATVQVRQKTLVGENYLSITRGTPSAGVLPDGSTLPLSADQTSVPLDKILNSLDPRTRHEIQLNMQTLGAGFNGHANDLSQMLSELQPTLERGATVMAVLAAQRTQVGDVVQNAGTLLQAVANRTADLRTLVTAAKQTAVAVAARDSAFEQAFRQLPPTLVQARTSVARLASLSGDATPVVTDLTRSLTVLRPVVRELRPTAVAARSLLLSLHTLIPQANPLLGSLNDFAGAGGPMMVNLDAALRQIVNPLDYLKPYTRDIGGLLANLSAFAAWDKYGAVGLCSCPVNEQSFAGFTPAEEAALMALLKFGGIDKVNGLVGNPLRRPGTLPAANAPFTGSYPRIQAEPPH
jgi:phospholipid/cholesterol/gamma-HCH transport system substrate-binding protein